MSDDMVLPPRNGLSLCAGAGGLDMGLMLAEPDFHTRCFVEWDEYPRQAIIAAQRAGYFAPAPIWDDVTTFDGKPFRGAFDAILAGYPCQPFSQAGQRRGENDERHLWPDIARIIREVAPRWVFLENVAGHVTLGADTVLRELRDMGWTPAAGLFSAGEVGAPHERLRWFCVAHSNDGSGALQPQGRVGHVGRWFGDSGVDVAYRQGRRCGERGNAPLAGRSGHADGAGGDMADADGRDAGSEWQQRGGEQRFQPEGGGIGAGNVADAHKPRPQRKQRSQCPPREWQDAHGFTRPPRGAGLFPPGPADAATWADTLATSPHLAPAAGLADCLAWARDMAETVEVEKQAEAHPALRRMAHGLAARPRALRLLGNGVVPLCAAYAWRTLSAAHGLRPVDMGAAARSGAGTAEPVG